MSWTDKLLDLCRRHGKKAKLAAGAVLGALLPGSPALLALVEKAFDTAEEKGHDHWEFLVDSRLDATSDDLERLGDILDVLRTDLSHVTAQVARLPDVAPFIIETALASDARCQEAARRLEGLAGRMMKLEQQQEKLLVGQLEMVPLLRRTVGVCDYVDELRAGGFSIEVFGELLRAYQGALRLLGGGSTAEAQPALERVLAARPLSASATIALAAAQTADRNFLMAEQTLTRARRLRPDDAELRELHNKVTSLSHRGTTPTDRTTSTLRRPSEGEALDGWLLEQLVGRGGWGMVFRARRDGRTMALKIMHPELSADALFVERFKREIMTLARLGKQPGLVEIGGFGYAREQACWYFVMEWVEGVTLQQRLERDGQLSLPTARALFTVLSEGPAAAHLRGIVHRDIKPANIMVRPDGSAVLVDFGLAAESEGGLTRTGQSAGYTALFAAPEQMRKGQADARSDVYSLAASLYYSLTFDDPERREPHRFKPRHVPEDIRELLTRSLDNDPSERPRDAGAFRDALLGSARSLVVDANGGGGFVSLAEALRQAATGSTITIKPGTYRESIVLDRTVTIVGDGPCKDIVIEAESAGVLSVTGGEATIRGITLRGGSEHVVVVRNGALTLEECGIAAAGKTGVTAGENSRLMMRRCSIQQTKEQGLLLLAGSSADLEECDVSKTRGNAVETQTGSKLSMRRCSVHESARFGVVIANEDAVLDHCIVHDNVQANVLVARGGSPRLTHCTIRDGRQGGLLFHAGGGLVEDCEIVGSALAGIESSHEAAPTIRRCTIHDGKQGGLLFSERGRGTIEDCDIFAFALNGIEIRSEGDPVLRRCKVRECRGNGVHVWAGGRGTFEDCAIHGHHLQGITVKDGGAPVLRKCRVHDNRECGVLLLAAARGTFEGCDVTGNALAGVEIKQESEPVLRGCIIHGGKQAGILVNERGRGLIEDCDIFENGLAGVEIKDQGDPKLIRCRIHDGRTSGLYVYADGRGTLLDCDIFGNTLQGVAVKQGGNPTLTKCRIHDGRECGVFVYENGAGVFENCDIYANSLANVEVKEGARPILRGCKVRQGKVCGVLVWVHATALIEECDISANTYAGIEIKQTGNPTVVRCRIHDNGGSAVYVHEQGTGTVEGCDLKRNRLGAFDVAAGSSLKRQGNSE